MQFELIGDKAGLTVIQCTGALLLSCSLQHSLLASLWCLHRPTILTWLLLGRLRSLCLDGLDLCFVTASHRLEKGFLDRQDLRIQLLCYFLFADFSLLGRLLLHRLDLVCVKHFLSACFSIEYGCHYLFLSWLERYVMKGLA